MDEDQKATLLKMTGDGYFHIACMTDLVKQYVPEDDDDACNAVTDQIDAILGAIIGLEEIIANT